jgi:hypothetical protein
MKHSLSFFGPFGVYDILMETFPSAPSFKVNMKYRMLSKIFAVLHKATINVMRSPEDGVRVDSSLPTNFACNVAFFFDYIVPTVCA